MQTDRVVVRVNGASSKLIRQWTFDRWQPVKAEYVFFRGGKDSLDIGSPHWGTAESEVWQQIGDTAGWIRIVYEDGTADEIPLVYGYTIWWEQSWNTWHKRSREPFSTDETAGDLLRRTLHLKCAYEGDFPYVLKVRLREQGVLNIEIRDNPLKNGQWVDLGLRFEGVSQGAEDADRASVLFDIADPGRFFDTRTIVSSDAYPPFIADQLRQLRTILYTFEDDIQSVDAADLPANYDGPSILFAGESETYILSSVFHHNLRDQIARVLPDGFVRESAHDAPLYAHSGIGTWCSGAGAYANDFYTRNLLISVLADLNQLHLCHAALNYLDRALMFFPTHYPEVQLDGKPIPGHWTVVAQNPLYYSKELASDFWKTSYTYERFGEHYQDFGNPETDGHGYCMIAHWKTWSKLGKPAEWVRERWAFIREAADYISWHLDHPALSFTDHGLLYAESEAGMATFTLQCNLSCYIGLLMYAEMAEFAGEHAKEQEWRRRADGLRSAMETYFAEYDEAFGDIWHTDTMWPSKVGTTLTFFQKFRGLDAASKLPEQWLERARNTYRKNRKVIEPHFFAPQGLGYDHNMYTQTALLMDEMTDASLLLKNLAKMCYAPRQPRPYIVPESAEVDATSGVYRRCGDLGNGLQQSETLMSIMICAGIDDTDHRCLRIMPRLPDKWELRVFRYPVTVSDGTRIVHREVELKVSGLGERGQRLSLRAVGGTIRRTQIRAGPFASHPSAAQICLDGKTMERIPCFVSGDRSWVWISDVELPADQEVELVVEPFDD